MKFGGAASAQQLTWLRQQLAEAKEKGQQAIVCCHLPLHPDTCPGACLLWNYEEALDACREAGNVVATLSGHAHQVPPSSNGTARNEYLVGSRTVRTCCVCNMESGNPEVCCAIAGWVCGR